MTVKDFYQEKRLWEEVLKHPQNILVHRDIKALEKFLPVVVRKIRGVTNILQLGIGDGREVPFFVNNFQIGTYVINDICNQTLDTTAEYVRKSFSSISFQKALVDIEQKDTLLKLRQNLEGRTLVVLVGNGGIFSNRVIDENIKRALHKDDLFLVTVETPHEDMFESYEIDPIYRLLSKSGLDVNAHNTETWYDENDQCLKMSCGGETLLSSYKASPNQLRQRLEDADLVEVVLEEYSELHMSCGLYKLRGEYVNNCFKHSTDN